MDQPLYPFALPKAFPRSRRANRVLAADRLDAAGRKVLRKLFLDMAGHQAGVLGGTDPQAIHDMRVTVRRMRAALDLFEDFLPSKTVKFQKQSLKKLGGALGAVRDIEVMLVNARAYQTALPKSHQPAIMPLLDFFEARRAAARAPLVELLESGDFISYLQATIVFLGEPAADGFVPAVPGRPSRVCDLVPALILERFGMVRSFEEHVVGLSLEQLHALRGGLKRLRYAVECFQEPLGPQARLLMETLKDLQDHLGKLNDADVAARTVQAFIQEREDGQPERAAAGTSSSVPFLTYLTRLLEQRDELVRTFPGSWSAFNTIDFRQRLSRSVARL